MKNGGCIMKRVLLFLTFTTLMFGTALGQLKKLYFTPQWIPQTQFAGYYVAKEKGFFKEVGLNVIFRHLKTETKQTPITFLQSNETQIITTHFLQALEAVDNGCKLVNILQTSQNNALMCVSSKKIRSIKELSGKNIGTWKVGFKEVAELAFMENDVKVNWIPFLNGVNLFVYKAVDATLCYSYSEFIRLYMIKGEIPEENKVYFSKIGYNYPEDGVYVTESFYNTHKTDLRKFAAAAKKGWDYARAHKEEAIKITQKYMKQCNVSLSNMHLQMMLDEVLRLQEDEATREVTYAPISPEVFKKVNEKLRKAGIIKHNIKYEEMFK
mgnify:CR=1 FL=1